MDKRFFVVPIILILIFGTSSLPLSYAQFQSGGVDYPGEWYAGEGLKKGDYFSYKLCYVDYKECTTFQMDLWISGDKQVGSEDKWLAKVVVYDGNKIVTGELELGKIAPEPTGGSLELAPYRSAFKSSVAWLSAFATAYGGEGGEGPKEFSAKSWGKIGNIGGEQVLPTAVEEVTVPAGTFESVLISWKTGGYRSKVWVVDNFPFPIKAETYTHVSEGIPPPEYKFELLDYKENVLTNPFEGIVSTSEQQAAKGCPPTDSLDASIKKPTKNFSYQLHVFYTPEEPMQGCPMSWLIKFISKYDETEFLNQVQYDLLVVDDNLQPIRSIAQEEGRLFLYSPSGQAQIDMIVKEPVGTANYVVWIYGLSPEGIVPSSEPDYLLMKLPVIGLDGESKKPVTSNVPSWIKTTAGYWVDGVSSDNEFVSAIQFLIKEGIIVVPPTSSGSPSGAEVPSWIKTTTGYWVDGVSSDNEFVSAIQFLIKEGIIVL